MLPTQSERGWGFPSMYRSGTVLAFSSEQTRNDRLNPESASAGSWDWALTCAGKRGDCRWNQAGTFLRCRPVGCTCLYLSVLGLLHLPVEGPTICSVLNSLGTDLETLPPMAKELGVRV